MYLPGGRVPPAPAELPMSREKTTVHPVGGQLLRVTPPRLFGSPEELPEKLKPLGVSTVKRTKAESSASSTRADARRDSSSSSARDFTALTRDWAEEVIVRLPVEGLIAAAMLKDTSAEPDAEPSLELLWTATEAESEALNGPVAKGMLWLSSSVTWSVGVD